jgi:hypothetical protein
MTWPSKRVVAIVTTLASLALQVSVGAQAVRQGNAEPDANAFRSPMVIQASFVAADRSIWGDKSWHEGPDYKELGKYTCDGLALRGDRDPKTRENRTGIAMRARELTDGRLEVTVGLWIFNPSHNHDKAVTIFLEVLDGSQTVAQTTLGPMDVEDKGHASFAKYSFVVPTNVLKPAADMKMRLTMTTKDD